MMSPPAPGISAFPESDSDLCVALIVHIFSAGCEWRTDSVANTSAIRDVPGVWIADDSVLVVGSHLHRNRTYWVGRLAGAEVSLRAK